MRPAGLILAERLGLLKGDVDAELDQPEVIEATEGVHPHTGDLDLDAHSGTGAKAHVATWSPRSSVTRVMR